MKSIKPFVFSICSTAIFTATQTNAANITLIQSSGLASSTWTTLNVVFNTRVFNFENNLGGILTGKTITVMDFIDHRATQAQRPFASITGTAISNSYYRSGASVNMATLTYGNADFLRFDSFVNNAQSGSDNFLAFKVTGTDSQNYYGWMQFELSSFSNGQVAAKFLGGMVGDTANTSFAASPVPEPSALSLLAIGLGGLAIFRRRRE